MSEVGKTIALIEAMKGSGGGSSLPSVSSADNGKVLMVENGAWAAGVQEYLIPVQSVGGTFSVPEDNVDEASTALMNNEEYWVRGIKIIGGGVYSGYVDTDHNFIVPLTKEAMSTEGYDCSGKMRITHVPGGGLAISLEPDKLIVTLTPTAADYSGTMDKTPQEITAAYNAGQKIVFDIPAMSAKVDADQYISSVVSVNNIRFGAKVFFDFNNAPVLITIVTNGADDAQTYVTGIYALTPAS